MQIEAPTLSVTDLTHALTQFHKAPHRALHTAFFGKGEGGAVRVPVRGDDRLFTVVHADCELRLREALSTAERTDQPLALLVDYTDVLPLDLQGRLANGALQFVSRERRLANLFNAASVAPAVLHSPLADVLLRHGRSFPGEGRNTVDEHAAFRAFLARVALLPPEGDLSAVMLVEYAASNVQLPELGALFAQAPALLGAVCDYLRRSAGLLGELAFRAYLAGDGRMPAARAFVLDALWPHRDEGYVRRTLDSVQLPPSALPRLTLLQQWAELASPLSVRLKEQPDAGTPGTKGVLHEVLAQADRELPFDGFGPYLSGSRFLRGGFLAGKQALSSAMLAALDALTATAPREADVHAAVEASVAANQQLARHRSADDALVKRADMAVRLLAYVRTQAEPLARLNELSELDAAVAAAEHYAAEGGFVDWARRMARGGAAKEPLAHAVDAVLAHVDALRDALDARFAKGLLRWNEERKAGALLPIEHALDALGVDFLRGQADRKLLILVMDGMGWSSAVEILRDLQAVHVAPLRFTAKQQKPSVVAQPMIAALPTVTDVSRSALFAGRLLRPGDARNTLQDPERLASHAGFAKLLPQGPRLLLRTHAEDDAGHLTAAARTLIASPDRAVALVLNAVDDLLSAKPSVQLAYGRATIKGLADVFQCARESARAVLLIADHGHVLSDRTRQLVEAPGETKSRYRELKIDGPVFPGELCSDAPTVYREQKGRRVALLVGETLRYRDAHHFGEHGGISLAEVVTPALLVGSDDLRPQTGAGEDEQLDTVFFPTPPWWELLLPKPKPAAVVPLTAPPPKSVRPPAKPPKPSPQLALLEDPPVATPAPVVVPPRKPSTPEVSPWEANIVAVLGTLSSARRDELRHKVLPMLTLLLDHGGRMPEDVLAGLLKEPVRNIGARAALMAEFLNLDGYEVVHHDRLGRQVRIEAAQLQELFGDAP